MATLTEDKNVNRFEKIGPQSLSEWNMRLGSILPGITSFLKREIGSLRLRRGNASRSKHCKFEEGGPDYPQ